MIDEKKLLDELTRKGQSLQRHTEDNKNELFNFGLKHQLAMLKNIIRCIVKQPKTDEWIPCSDRLPKEPSQIPLTTEEVERMIENEILQECIVTMYGAKKSTTLFYAGNGEWYDPVTVELYDVIAWRPLPDPYKPNNQAAAQKEGES